MKSLVPVYYQIKEAIRNRIINKEYLPGEKIPSINKLAEEFGVNFLTVREAIRQLVQEGFLYSRRGSGTFINSREALKKCLNVEITGFMDELFYQVQKAKTKTADISVVKAPGIILEKLNLDADSEVIKIDRVRMLDKQYFNCMTNYLPKEIGEKITKKALLEKPLLQILEQDLKLKFTEAVQIVQAVFATQEISAKLHVPVGTPILFIERVLYGKNKKPIQIVNAFYRGDLFKYIARFQNVERDNTSTWIHEKNNPW